MKMLMIYCERFSYNPTIKTLEEFDAVSSGNSFNNTLVAFIHAEENDESDIKKTETKMVKNLKWAAKKNDTKNVLLHSFAHLAQSKANPAFTKTLFDQAEERMNSVDYNCSQTAFGYFMDLEIMAPGISQARIFKSF